MFKLYGMLFACSFVYFLKKSK
ncbi:sortase B protein-sorting domain-containing protein [Helicobacter turcicus]